MIKSIICALLAIFTLLNISGCWFIVGGAAGAAGAYAMSKDTIEGDTDKPYEALWSSAQNVARIHGTITSEDYTKGVIQLKAQSSLVWIKLVRLTHATTKLKVSARKLRMPNLALVQDIYTKIMEEAK